MDKIVFVKRGEMARLSEKYGLCRKTVYNILRNSEHPKHEELKKELASN